MAKEGIHCFVSGKVQGVFYRAFTKKNALSLQLTGWARNLPDGRVELQAFGEKEQLQQFETLLRQGPPAATVNELHSQTIPWQELQGFRVID